MPNGIGMSPAQAFNRQVSWMCLTAILSCRRFLVLSALGHSTGRKLVNYDYRYCSIYTRSEWAIERKPRSAVAMAEAEAEAEAKVSSVESARSSLFSDLCPCS